MQPRASSRSSSAASPCSRDVESIMKPLAIITGVGPGTGAAMARRFHAGGYQVAMIARNGARLAELARELSDSFAVACDVSDAAAFLAALDGISARAGAPKVIIHNAVGG